MDLYDLSCTEYTERVVYLFLKSLRHEEECMEELYNLLTADGSDSFLHMLDIVTETQGTAADFICYFLLISVRYPKEIALEAINNAIEVTQKILEDMANEKRE